MSLSSAFRKIAIEPPFRLLTQAAMRWLPVSVRHKAAWDVVQRPEYLFGVLEAADQAKRQGVGEICAIEFGVAGGNGLLAMQAHAEAVEKETSVKIYVFGFDTGAGLPPAKDYRDHPETWKQGDYAMAQAELQKRLSDRTQLLLGDIADTIDRFVAEIQPAPVGFVSIDVDLYSSSMAAFKVFTLPRKQMLLRVPMVFDDINFAGCHEFAGELAAIRDFNEQNAEVKIDRYRGVEKDRPFFEAAWLRNMYMAHDLSGASRHLPRREAKHLPLTV